MNSSVTNQLTRGEQLILDYLSDQPGKSFSKPQKYLSQAIGYSRQNTNKYLQKLARKGLISSVKVVGVDPRLKVISLVNTGIKANG